jgi:hypothetical protein
MNTYDRILKQMNSRDYLGAIQTIETFETSHGSADPRISFLLVQAHLGAAGFELLSSTARVLSEQAERGDSDTKAIELLGKTDCREGAMPKLAEQDLRCVLGRVLRQLPDAEHPHWLQAQKLLRKRFSDVRATSSEVNFLAGIVEAGSFLKRWELMGRRVLAREKDPDFDFYLRNLKRSTEELMELLRRIRYSYSKIRTFVVQYDGRSLLKINQNQLLFDENLSLSSLGVFLEQVVLQIISERKGEIDQTIYHYLGLVSDEFYYWLVTLGLVEDFARLRDINSPSHALRYETLFRGIMDVLRGEAETPTGDSTTWMQVLWHEPPILIQTLLSAIRYSWNEENSEYFVQYLKDYGPAWMETRSLLLSWLDFMYDPYYKIERERFMKVLKEKLLLRPYFLRPHRDLIGPRGPKIRQQILKELERIES